MNKKEYLPVWTDECTGYDRQYLACNIILSYKHMSKESLLPVRFKYDLTLYNRGKQVEFFLPHNVYEVENAYGPKHVVMSYGTEYAFAESVYQKAAELLFEKYPDIEDFDVGQQKENGLYPIEWKYQPADLKKELFEIIKKLIENGFSIKESIKCTEIRENAIEFRGVFDYDDEYVKLFKNNRYDAIADMFREREYRYSFEDCLPYYVEIDDSLLKLGNQQRIYITTYEQNKPLFEAAKAGDIDRLCALAEEGYNLNTIDKYGHTPFFEYVELFFWNNPEVHGKFSEKLREDMERLVALGANPAVFGVTNDFESPLQSACVVADVEVVKFLLEKGVNPNMYMYTDDYYEKDTTLFDWVKWHTSEYGDEKNPEMDEVYEILKEAIKQMKDVADL